MLHIGQLQSAPLHSYLWVLHLTYSLRSRSLLSARCIPFTAQPRRYALQKNMMIKSGYRYALVSLLYMLKSHTSSDLQYLLLHFIHVVLDAGWSAVLLNNMGR